MKLLNVLVITWSLFLGSALYAQVPHIDHLEIENATGRLTIIGNFGIMPGIVTIDSFNVLYNFWSADTIVCTINDTGRGSCGPVQVTNPIGTSNERLLTMWYVEASTSFGTHGPDHDFRQIDVHLMFRLDLICEVHSFDSIVFLSSQNTKIHDVSGSNPDYGYQGSWQHHDSSYLLPIQTTFNFKSHIIDFSPILEYYQGRLVDFPAPIPVTNSFISGGYSSVQYTSIYMNGIPGNAMISNTVTTSFFPNDSLLSGASASVNSQRIHSNTFRLLGANNLLRFKLTSTPFPRKIELFDSEGREVANIPVGSGETTIETPLCLSSGLYFARLDRELLKIAIQ